jgi:cysteine desulfurase
VICLDHNATTRLRPVVREAMERVLAEPLGNPSSAHALGRRARSLVEGARRAVARAVGARPSEIVFTSGGTESNNLALFGLAGRREGAHLLVAPIEHSSVIAAAGAMEGLGVAVSWLPVDRFGRVRAADVDAAIRPETVLVSVGWANNEIGTIQPLAEISAVCRRRGVALHTDAVQAFGKLPVDVSGVDLCSLSAHKIGGPGGVGALFVRRGLRLSPILFGGEQERGLRPGSESVASLHGFGVAAVSAGECRLPGPELRERLWRGIESIGGASRNSPTTGCLDNTLNVSIAGIAGEGLVAALDLEGVAVSVGSACAVGSGRPSHVLQAIGKSTGEARDGVRFSLGADTTEAEVDRALAVLTRVVDRMRGVGRAVLAASA